MTPGPQSEVWGASREMWPKGTSERLPGAVLAPRGSGRVIWKGLRKVPRGEMTKESRLVCETPVLVHFR